MVWGPCEVPAGVVCVVSLILHPFRPTNCQKKTRQHLCRTLLSGSPNLPRSAAVDINNSEIEALVRKMAADSVGDQAIRIVAVNDEYNLAIGVVSRLKTTPQQAPSAIEHSHITEIYHVISGSGTLVTGGMLKDSKETPANDETVTLLNGPSKEGSGIENGVSRKIGPGDVVIIPPNTPHWFSEIPTEKIIYSVVRVDPDKVLPGGYIHK